MNETISILVAEDNPNILLATATLLRSVGYFVLEARSLIYFQLATFHFTLKHKGFLFLVPSEGTGGLTLNSRLLIAIGKYFASSLTQGFQTICVRI